MGVELVVAVVVVPLALGVAPVGGLAVVAPPVQQGGGAVQVAGEQEHQHAARGDSIHEVFST